MISALYRGSVKDVLGPVTGPTGEMVVFRYSDAFSVFDWGRMPDSIPHKGEALAVLGAALFSKLEDPKNWQDFSRSQTALQLRKGVTSVHSIQLKKGIRDDESPTSLGSAFNELGEKLQKEGLRTHYLGVLTEKDLADDQVSFSPRDLNSIKTPVKFMCVRQVSVVKPTLRSVMGKGVVDYAPTRGSTLPRLVPLEVVFRFGCPEGSSLIERVAKSPSYWESLPIPGELASVKLKAGTKWDFPVLELFTKLESTDRPVLMNEALAISGLAAGQMQELMLKAVWVAGFLKGVCTQAGLELWDGKLEFGLDKDGSIFLVDAIGPDELRLMVGGVHLSKEFIRAHYRDSEWYAQTVQAKSKASVQQSSDWKRWVNVAPPALPASELEIVSNLYMTLTQVLTGTKWFPQAWSLDRLVTELQKVTGKKAAPSKKTQSAQTELSLGRSIDGPEDGDST